MALHHGAAFDTGIVYNARPFKYRILQMLEVSNLACSRGDHRLFSGLSFTLRPGEIMQVQGENGSGKTTLLRTLCGFVSADEGGIAWNGAPVASLGEGFHAEMLYLGHLNAIKDDLSGLENLKISAALSGQVLTDATVKTVLRRLGLKGRELLPCKVLSQGQRRRVALARLLVSEARLWVLDEPLAALDVRAVGLIQDLIAEHLSRGGMAIFTTHQPLQVDGMEVRTLALS